MLAFLVCGSPRAGGNTEFLLKRCLGRLEKSGISTQFVPLSGKTIRPCTACGTCFREKDEKCATKDDDFHEVFDLMKGADIIVTGSPVYFGSATPELMALLHRAGCVSLANGRLFSRKIGGPIVVARRAGENFTYAQLLFWYTINDMIVPGSTYWNVGIALEKGEVEKDEEALRTVDRFAENIAWLAERIL